MFIKLTVRNIKRILLQNIEKIQIVYDKKGLLQVFRFKHPIKTSIVVFKC